MGKDDRFESCQVEQDGSLNFTLHEQFTGFFGRGAHRGLKSIKLKDYVFTSDCVYPRQVEQVKKYNTEGIKLVFF
jgi:hypothetical protein